MDSNVGHSPAYQSVRRAQNLLKGRNLTNVPRNPQPGASVPLPQLNVISSLRTPCCKIVLVAHQAPKELAPVIVIPSEVTSIEYPSEVGRPAASRNSVAFEPRVKKMELETAAVPVTTDTSRLRADWRSELKVFANARRVGGMSVSPSVFVESWNSASTTIEVTSFNEKVLPQVDAVNGTVGIPTHLAAKAVSLQHHT